MTTKAFRERLERRAARARVAVPPDAAEPLETYFRLLVRWNQKVNLTALALGSLTDATIDRLLIEPLAAAGRIDDAWSPWIDLGSGGGSPAIPLKLVRPALSLTMVESKARKAAFLREAVRELRIEAATVETARFEAMAQCLGSAAVGLVTVRGVRVDDSLAVAIRSVLRDGAHLLIFSSAPTHEPLAGFVAAKPVRLVPEPTHPAWLIDLRRD